MPPPRPPRATPRKRCGGAGVGGGGGGGGGGEREPVLSDTLAAMNCVGISPAHTHQLLRLLAGLLHLGNVGIGARATAVQTRDLKRDL